MKKNGIVIKRIVDDRDTGIYIKSDLLNGTIIIGKGTKRRRFALWEAERLEFLLRRQIDRINGNYPKEGVKEGNADVIKSSPSQTEIDEIQIQFEERMQSWLERQPRFRFTDSGDQEKQLTVSGEMEMKNFINKIMRLAEEEKISMEVMNQLPYFLKKELKRNSERLEKEKAFTVSQRC